MSRPSAARARVAAVRTARRPDLAELALLLAPGAALLAGQPLIALGSLLAWLIWIWIWRPPARERWLMAACGVAVALLLAIGAGREHAERRVTGISDAQLTRDYGAYWAELADVSGRAMSRLARPPLEPAAALEAFASLGEVARESRLPGLTLLLLDADRQPVAWGGAGLLHDLGPAGAEGRSAGKGGAGEERYFLQSAASATAIVVRSLTGRDGSRFQLVCGESRSRRGAPPLVGESGLHGGERGAEGVAVGGGTDWVWGFGGGAAASPVLGPELAPVPGPVPERNGGRLVRSAGLPPLVLATGWQTASRPEPPRRDERAAVVLGLGLFGLAALRGFALAVLAGTVLRRPLRIFEVAALALSGVAILGLGLGVPAAGLLLLLGGLALAGLGWFRSWSRVGAAGGRAGAAFSAVAALSAVPGIMALARYWPTGALDLGADFALAGSTGAARLGLAAALFGLFALAARRTAASEGAGRLGVAAALVLILVAAAGHDHGLWALVPLVAGAAFALQALRGPSGRTASGLMALLLMAVAISATAWEIGFRQRAFALLSGPLASLLPPEPARKAVVATELESYFDRLDVAEIAPEALPRTDEDDLAYVLWRGSPLARLDAISGLVVERPGKPASSFAYGLPLTDALDLDLAPARWSGLAPPAWRDERIEGRYPLVGGGRAIGEVRFWMVPRPGFSADAAAPTDLAAALLRGGAGRARTGASGLPGPDPAPVLYSPDGEILASPWREGTPALAEVRAAVAAGRRGGATIATPEGGARVLL
ncbi:MAG: hypothetical protein ABIV06_03790, partial [Thermoanaerobaculia bacterium]